MGLIKMTPDELRTSASKYTQSSQQIDSMLTELKGMQSEISSNWEGQAFVKYDEQFNDLSATVVKFSELLVQINEQLNNAATVTEEMDAQLSNTFGRA